MDEDIISSLRFDQSGKYIALGDRAGRIIVFEAHENKKGASSYEYFTEFQSHFKEFDPLRSMEVEEEIVELRWLRPQGKYLKMITTNCRSIKLWKMFEKTEKKVVKGAGKQLSMPKLQAIDQSYAAQTQKIFPSKHVTSINSLSTSYNEEYLLSSDEGQIFLWNMEKPEKPFVLANYLPKNENEEQKELITCS